jgi:hypothetical protein
MNIIYLTFFITTIFFTPIDALKINTINKDIKLCINCNNFIKKIGIPDEFGDCKLFTLKINYITGVHPYVPALVSRKLDNLCGIDGKYYDDINIIDIKEVIDNDLDDKTNKQFNNIN